MTLARRSGAHTPARAAACQALLQRLRGGNREVDNVRISWADLHGNQRAKTLVLDAHASSLASALDNGVGMVSTLFLKDSSDRTAFNVFEPGALDALPGFGSANNALLLPDPTSFIVLPWAPRTGWLRAQPLWPDGSPVVLDPRPLLQQAVSALAAYAPAGASRHGAAQGLKLLCGLEVEFHIYRIISESLSPHAPAWSADAPELSLLHPGYALLSEAHADLSQAALDLVRQTLLGLGLPLVSLEIELGPSQFEVVLAPTDALTAADHMILLRNGLRQALRRAGLYASFVCRPPFDAAVASGWHLHHSLLDSRGQAVLPRQVATGKAARASGPAWPSSDARSQLSDVGTHWLGGLLAHAPGMTALCAPTPVAYSRYQGSVMAPRSAQWGFDNRGAMLRVSGHADHNAVRIENRLPEPLANPYLMMAAHIWAGLDGLQRQLDPGPATDNPYAKEATPLPASLADALHALQLDETLQVGLGAPMMLAYQAIKKQELARQAQAEDRLQWERREYLARY